MYESWRSGYWWKACEQKPNFTRKKKEATNVVTLSKIFYAATKPAKNIKINKQDTKEIQKREIINFLDRVIIFPVWE